MIIYACAVCVHTCAENTFVTRKSQSYAQSIYVQEQRAFDQVLCYREETMLLFLNKATRCICQKKLIETDQTDSLSTLLITQK